ncbi:hypothetical protein [Lysobacter gummosus]|uniref:hypothetical protein n=1 Tax=Lysobacter gummosus TaxID=262324 RepID=UPI0036416680
MAMHNDNGSRRRGLRTRASGRRKTAVRLPYPLQAGNANAIYRAPAFSSANARRPGPERSRRRPARLLEET